MICYGFLLLMFFKESFASTQDLINQQGGELILSGQINREKTLELDNPFRIQVYTLSKTLGKLERKAEYFIQTFLSKEYKKSLSNLETLNKTKLAPYKEAIELYLLYSLELYQTFTHQWIKLASTQKLKYLDSDLGVALDQMITDKGSDPFWDSGVFLTRDEKLRLKELERASSSGTNNILQGFKALRRGEDALKWIGNLGDQDKLKVYLAKTLILDFSKKRKLGASGKLIKNILEPYIEKSSDVYEIAEYYLILARLLYQAKAYKQAETYYKLIPESSPLFVQARSEILWVHLQQRDFAKVMGDLASLKLSVFDKDFYPEIYLSSAIGHTMLCQFTDARESIHRFVKVNREWVKQIDKNLKKENPPLIKENFVSKLIKRQLEGLESEKEFFQEIKVTRYQKGLKHHQVETEKMLSLEAKRHWENRERILEKALYKMKFVRIELLSRMRSLSEGLLKGKGKWNKVDMLKTYSSASVKRLRNQLEFLYDGMLWSDEIFHLSAEVRNECLLGKVHEKK